ncbi:MAG: NAD-dependent malic enzyme [Dehalococcoidia bacterium]|nr:NAD-dependent malic enzyme [Dehalococcoidia bacterium]|tara:strand:- start:1364 stop:2785 length:1422 start_codon:yes stop_codon:yes gene_type:complete
MATRQPGIAHSVTLRAEYANHVGMLGNITSAISLAGGDIGAIDIVSTGSENMIRDITVNARDEQHSNEIIDSVSAVEGVRIVNVSDQVFLRHLGGKIEMQSKTPVKTRNDMSIVYTPGVARVSSAIQKDPESVWNLTSKSNTVAVVTDGSAVLGLGNIGAAAALPVMEGKAQLLKELTGVDAWPIALDTNDPDEIIKTVKLLATGFGGINLEDISAPRCFYIERRLKEELDIPVFHDDQHGTAVVVVAGLLNALKVVEKKLSDVKVVVAGIGAAGIATTDLMITAGISNIIGVDRHGILSKDDTYPENEYWELFSKITNPNNVKGGLTEAIKNADVFIGLSGPNVVSVDQIKTMNSDAIVFAMSNPDPEIWPEDAHGLVRIMATGRSDYPNQVNNALCFPGMFRGVLDARATEINDEMKLAAAQAIADGVPERHLNDEYIMPSIFDAAVARRVARAVTQTARKTGVARRKRSR